MEELKKFLERRIRHCEKRIKEIQKEHGENPVETHNYYGGVTSGYWKGLKTAYENVLDKIE